MPGQAAGSGQFLEPGIFPLAWASPEPAGGVDEARLLVVAAVVTGVLGMPRRRPPPASPREQDRRPGRVLRVFRGMADARAPTGAAKGKRPVSLRSRNP